MKTFCLPVAMVAILIQSCATTPAQPTVNIDALRARFAEHPECLAAIDEHIEVYGPLMIETYRKHGQSRAKEHYQWGKKRGSIRRLRLDVKKNACVWTAKRA